MYEFERKILRLEACESIRYCVYAYALAGDQGNDSAILSEIFSENVTWESPGMGRFVGREEALAGLAEIGKSVVLWSFHAPSGPHIKLADDLSSASVFWWVWVPAQMRGEDGETSSVWGAGQYNSTLVPTKAGWRFTKIKFEPRMITPFEGPWTQMEGPFTWPK